MTIKYTRGWLSEDEADHIYLSKEGVRIPWSAFCVDSCTGMSAKLAREWAVKLQELSTKLMSYANAMDIEMTDTEEEEEDD